MRRGGADRRPGDHRAARAPAAQLPRHAVPLPGHADAARRRRDGPHPGRQQQRLVPGQRDLLVRLGHRRVRRAAARLHAPADRAAARPPGVPPPPVPARDRGGGLRAAGRLVVPARRAPDDQARLGERARASACSSTARRSPRPTSTASGSSTTRSCCSSTAATRTSSSGCRPSRFGRRWTTELRTDDPDAEPGAVQVSAGEHVTVPALSMIVLRRAELRGCASAPPTGCSSGPGMGFAQARELVPYLRDLGDQPPVPAAVVPGARGLRRTATTWSTRRGSRTSSAASASSTRWRRPRSAPGMGLILDVVPNHMAVDDANRYWADPALRSRFFDIDEATGRHRRFFDIDHLAAVRQEDEHVFEETHRLALRLAREGTVDGLRVDHPDGLADPAGYLRRLRDGGAQHVWVEKILDPGEPLRDWPVDGTVGYEFLNDVAALFVDPAGEAPLTDLWTELARRRPAVRRGRARGQARAGARAVRARGRPAAARGAARGRRARAHARVAAGVPDLRRAVVGPGRRRRPRGDPRGRAAGVARARAAAAGPRLGRVRHPLPADDAGDHGQGRRGHRVLPLRPAAGAQRRRRRPEPLRDHRRAASTPPTASARGASRPTCSSRRRTTPSARATCARGSARWRACRTSGRRTCGAGSRRARRCAGRTRSSATSSSRRSSARGRSSPSGSRPTSRRRCARRSATRAGSSPTRRTRSA